MKNKTQPIFNLPFCLVFLLGGCIPSTQSPVLEHRKPLPAASSPLEIATPEESSIPPSPSPLVHSPSFVKSSAEPTLPIPSPRVEPGIPTVPLGLSYSYSGGAGSSKPVDDFAIHDVKLMATGKSISAQSQNGALQTVFNQSHEVELALTGNFTQPVLSLNDFTFTQVPGLRHLSVRKDELPYRITFGESLLLTPISVAPHEIKVRLNTEGLSDLFLNEEQPLRITANQAITSHFIRIEASAAQGTLIPQIQSVQLIPSTTPPQLKITGKNFPIQPHLNHISIDNNSLHPIQTAIKEVDGELIWEHWASFETAPPPEGDFSVFYSSPFGVSFYTFTQGT